MIKNSLSVNWRIIPAICLNPHTLIKYGPFTGIISMNKEHLISQRNDLRHLLADFPIKLEDKPPEQWFWTIAVGVVRTYRHRGSLPPEMRAHLTPILEHAVQLIREEIDYFQTPNSPTADQNLRALRADIHMMGLSREMALPYEVKVPHIQEHHLSFEQILSEHGDVLKTDRIVHKGQRIRRISYKDPNSGTWDSDQFSFLMPPGNNLWHKGGVARLMMDICAPSPLSMFQSEAHINDFDGVAIGDKERAMANAELIGIDPAGLEMGTEKNGKLDGCRFYQGRDTTQNQAYFGNDGLYFSEAARKAAQTGHVNIVGAYIADKAIYGIDTFTYKGIRLAKPRGLMREVKAVSEGKALSFDHCPLNSNLDFGVYWLFLSKKWSKLEPEEFSLRMQKMFYLGGQINQINADETHVMDVLERVHEEYPFFNIDRKIENIVDVTRWISRKLIKQVDREFAWEYQIPSGVEFVRSKLDEVPHRISLDGFHPQNSDKQRLLSEWPKFIDRCRARTRNYEFLHIKPIERHFIDVDIENLPDSLDD